MKIFLSEQGFKRAYSIAWSVYLKWVDFKDKMHFGIGNMLKSYTIKILGPLTLILSRQHYTIDIFVASLVYFFVYTHVDLFNFT